MLNPATDIYSYRPLPHWEKAIFRLGELAGQPEGREWRPLFDLVKQLATSCLSVSVHPSLVDRSLYLSKGPLPREPLHQARIRIDRVGWDEFEAHVFEAESTEAFSMSFTRIEALPALTSVLGMR